MLLAGVTSCPPTRASVPMAIFGSKLSCTILHPAFHQTATFHSDSFHSRAAVHIATFAVPEMLDQSALVPNAVFCTQSTLALSAASPRATFPSA